MLTPTLAQEISQLQADFCFALADPTRILILYALDDAPRNVTEIGNELGVPLKILRERGLVGTVRQGTTVTYSLADHRLIEALDLLRSVMRDRLASRASLMEEMSL
jgi:ArsR family transcriptional regulator